MSKITPALVMGAHPGSTPDPTRAVPFEDLPLVEQARWLRRHEPDKAVAFALQRTDGTQVARMFFDASRGGALDAETARALRQWAQMVWADRALIGAGR